MLDAPTTTLGGSAALTQSLANASSACEAVEPEFVEVEGKQAERVEAVEVRSNNIRDTREGSIESDLTDLSDQEDVVVKLTKNRQLPTPSPSSASTSFSSAKPASLLRGTSLSGSDKGRKSVGTRRTREHLGADGEEDETKGFDGKEYLIQGLYYSPGITPPLSTLRKPTSRRRSLAPASLSWRTITPSASTAFPPPIHHGLTLIEDDEEPFKLPFEFLRDFYYADGAQINGKGGAGDRDALDEAEARKAGKKPTQYRNIQTNYYFERKADKASIPAVCMCKPPKNKTERGCLEQCINRMMQYCCDAKLCPCGDQCSNLALNKRETLPEGKEGLKVFYTGDRGWGLKTMQPIRKGELVIEYRGEIIPRDESYRRVLIDYKDRSDYYFLEYDGTFEVIDAGAKGNSSRFINHSCGPNCEVVRWRLAIWEEYQVGIFAKRDIRPGEELTYNYGWQNFVDVAGSKSSKSLAPSISTPTSDSTAVEATNDIARQRCFCGSPVCSGFLGAKPKDSASSGTNSTSSMSRKDSKGKDRAAETVQFVEAKVVLSETRTGKKKVETDGSNGGEPPKKKFKARVSELLRSTSRRGAAAKATERLAGQR